MTIEARVPSTFHAHVIMDLYYESLRPNSDCHAFLITPPSGKPWKAYQDLDWATEECRKRNRELARQCPVDLSLFYHARRDGGVNCPPSGGAFADKFWDEDELRMRNLDQATDDEMDQILDCLGLKFCKIQTVELL